MISVLLAATLHFAGSSILDDGGRSPAHYPYASWGTELERHMFPTNGVRNLARSGSSTKSFRASGLWQKLIDGVRPGDFVGMQFGGNDQKRSNEFYLNERYAPPRGLYTEILRGWIGEVRAKGATPILISHFPRCTFDASGRKLVENGAKGEKLSDYREAMRRLAEETACDFVDMNSLVRARVESLGREEALLNYVISTGYRKGKDGEPSKDTTHPCARGAEMYARIFIDDVRRQGLPVAALFEPGLGWERPKTTRRYLQGPLAERLLVAYREGKVVHGEMIHEKDWRRWKYVCQPACGVWLVHGEGDETYDFRTARMRADSEGVPIHGQSWKTGDLTVDFEACSPIERRPSAHIRVTVRNGGASPAAERIGFLVRNGQEKELVFGAPDIYRVYNPRVRSWKGLDCAWHREGDAIVLKDLFVSFRGDSEATWDAEEGILRFPVELKPGEAKTYDLVLGRQDRVVRPDYEAARARTREGWRKELARAKDLTLLEKCLLVQILQCYARASKGDVILPRQGGLQRWVWPWDQSYAAGALTQLGYGEYVEMACDFYFGEYAQPEGNVGPFGMGWINDTANVLGIFSRHCLETKNAAFWQKHRAAAERAFRWMKAERAKSASLPGQVAGLFPAGVASDNPKVFQSWGTTDLLNLQGLESYARAAKAFGDSAADEAAAEAADYRATIAKILDRWRQAEAGRETFSIPYRPDGSDQELLRGSGYFYLHPGYFACFGFLDEADMLKVRRYMLQEGLANERGLYFHHPAKGDPELGDHVWYTTAAEYCWHLAWKRVGRDDLARQALWACLTYSVTDEFQVGERMHDASPWYFPWSPNASGAGRILQMLRAEAGRTGLPH